MVNLVLILLAGTLFGSGLVISHMVEPQRIIGFLDITGEWDPTLAFVMTGALAVTLPTFRLILRQTKPALASEFRLPTKTKPDPRLIIGAAIFGVGWGLAGYCPGPALTALSLGWQEPGWMVVGMLAGGWLARRFT
mgnify:CR=1 FL=1